MWRNWTATVVVGCFICPWLSCFFLPGDSKELCSHFPHDNIKNKIYTFSGSKEKGNQESHFHFKSLVVVWKSEIARMRTLQKRILRKDVIAIFRYIKSCCKEDENVPCVQNRKQWAKIAADKVLTLGVVSKSKDIQSLE